jgi:hypothetical protein
VHFTDQTKAARLKAALGALVLAIVLLAARIL